VFCACRTLNGHSQNVPTPRCPIEPAQVPLCGCAACACGGKQLLRRYPGAGCIATVFTACTTGTGSYPESKRKSWSLFTSGAKNRPNHYQPFGFNALQDFGAKGLDPRAGQAYTGVGRQKTRGRQPLRRRHNMGERDVGPPNRSGLMMLTMIVGTHSLISFVFVRHNQGVRYAVYHL